MVPEPDGGDELVDLDDLDDLDAGDDPDAGADPGADPARGPRARRGPRRRVVVAGVVVAVLVTAGLVRGGGPGDGDGGGEGPPLDGRATAEQLFPVLAGQPVNPLTPLDDPSSPSSASSPGSPGSPDGPLATSLGVVPGSARRLGATASVTLWLARGTDGGVCLLAADTGSEALGGTCATAAQVAARGLRLGSGTGAAAVVVPRGFDTSELAAAGYARIAPALWVDGETAGRTAEALVDAASVRTVVVPSESHRGDDALAVFLTTDRAPYAAVLACPVDAALRVAVDGAAPEAVACGTDGSFVTFDGDGSPMRVEVTAGRGVVWAAAVVACTGSLLGPQC